MEEEANKLNIKELHNAGAEKVLRLLKVMKLLINLCLLRHK